MPGAASSRPSAEALEPKEMLRAEFLVYECRRIRSLFVLVFRSVFVKACETKNELLR